MFSREGAKEEGKARRFCTPLRGFFCFFAPSREKKAHCGLGEITD